MAGIGKGTALLIVLFVATVLPFALFSTPLGSIEDTPFSIYNEGWNGLSEFREIVESKFPEDRDGDGYADSVKTIISSINAVNRLENETGILVVMGPAVHYDISEALALVLFLMQGGTVIIADDFGTANDLLKGLNILISVMGSLIGIGGATEGLLTLTIERERGEEMERSGEIEEVEVVFAGIGFNQSVLIETSDYSLSPTRPILHQNQYAPMLSGTIGRRIDNIIADFATIISMQVRATDPDWNNATWWMPFPGLLGWLETSTHYAWLESDVKKLGRGNYAWNSSEWAGGLSLSIDVTLDAGEYGNHTFEDYEYETGFCVATGMQFGPKAKLFLCADPSIFINKYLNPTEYGVDDPKALNTQNRELADGLIDWVVKGYEDHPVFFFDEGHLENSPRSPIIYTGESLRYIALISMFPFTAPFFPIFVFMIARRFMPRRTAPSARLLTKLERYYGRSFFAIKMRWYTEYEQYGHALNLLYRRLSRIVHEKTKITETDPESLARAIASVIPTADPTELAKGLKQIQVAFRGRGVNEEQFLRYFYLLKSITDKLVGGEAT